MVTLIACSPVERLFCHRRRASRHGLTPAPRYRRPAFRRPHPALRQARHVHRDHARVDDVSDALLFRMGWQNHMGDLRFEKRSICGRELNDDGQSRRGAKYFASGRQASTAVELCVAASATASALLTRRAPARQRPFRRGCTIQRAALRTVSMRVCTAIPRQWPARVVSRIRRSASSRVG